MANKLLIVHGYSDGRTSFTALGEYLIKRGVYPADSVFYLNYSSMDDEATFHDFADKLDADYRARFDNERMDVIATAPGLSSCAPGWRCIPRARRGGGCAKRSPVRWTAWSCLAPANFGSDLADLGQSFLGKFRATFFNKNAHKGDAGESGKASCRDWSRQVPSSGSCRSSTTCTRRIRISIRRRARIRSVTHSSSRRGRRTPASSRKSWSRAAGSVRMGPFVSQVLH
jgi:hypothetical protein